MKIQPKIKFRTKEMQQELLKKYPIENSPHLNGPVATVQEFKHLANMRGLKNENYIK